MHECNIILMHKKLRNKQQRVFILNYNELYQCIFSKEETVTKIFSILFKSDNLYQLKLVWMKENTEIPQGSYQSMHCLSALTFLNLCIVIKLLI